MFQLPFLLIFVDSIASKIPTERKITVNWRFIHGVCVGGGEDGCPFAPPKFPMLYVCNFGQLASHKSLILFYECSLNIAFKIFDTYRLLYVAGTYHETAVFVTALCVGWLAENLKIHIHYI